MTEAEQLKDHVTKTVREYLAAADYPVTEPKHMAILDAVVGSALISGMCLMSDWMTDLQAAGYYPSEVRECLEGVGRDFGYTLHE